MRQSSLRFMRDYQYGDMSGIHQHHIERLATLQRKLGASAEFLVNRNQIRRCRFLLREVLGRLQPTRLPIGVKCTGAKPCAVGSEAKVLKQRQGVDDRCGGGSSTHSLIHALVQPDSLAQGLLASLEALALKLECRELLLCLGRSNTEVNHFAASTLSEVFVVPDRFPKHASTQFVQPTANAQRLLERAGGVNCLLGCRV